MDAKITGEKIAELRKKAGLTQAELASRLNISDKTVSRWENGLGYPEITQLPKLAGILGVTSDYLLTSERKGIAIAGNMINDIVKTIDTFPQIGMLTNISRVTPSVGGCALNTSIDIAKIDKNLPLTVLGKIGDDEYGRFLVNQLTRHGINCSKISYTKETPTSFCDVMSQPSGERTFFHLKGANAEFSPKDIDIKSLNAAILHIGYILLLDEFDKKDAEYGTVMARFLHDVQEAGIKTSIDVVSSSVADYKGTIIPALKYADYAILNEIESCMLTDLEPATEDGKPHVENIRKTMEFMVQMGVKEKVIVHCKQAGFCLDAKTGEFTCVPSLKLPKEVIKGSVGAGDAYCAGCLYGIYNGYSDKKMLEFASCAAASSLFSENSVDGMLEKEQIEALDSKYERLEV